MKYFVAQIHKDLLQIQKQQPTQFQTFYNNPNKKLKSKMGSTCNSTPTSHELLQLSFPALPLSSLSQKLQTHSIRFAQPQKLRSPNPLSPNLYTFLLPIKHSDQLIKIQCPIISSYSDHLILKYPLLSSYAFLQQDGHPIVDFHDADTRQILHKFVIREREGREQRVCVKAYPFVGINDDNFKSAIYERYLHGVIQKFGKNGLLRDFFIVDKGEPKAAVFVYDYYLCTLQDVLRYRSQSSTPYSIQEQNYIINQILQKYRILELNSIIHRDIRPSKILLADSSHASHISPYTANSPYYSSSPSPSIQSPSLQSLGYEFANLQTCRRISQFEKLQKDMMMTVRGVPQWSDVDIKVLAQSGNQIGSYDANRNQRLQLIHTILAISTLELEPDLNFRTKKINNKYVMELIKKLDNPSIPFQQIYNSFSSLSQNSRYNAGILQSDYKICRDFLPKLMMNSNNFSKNEQSSTQLLLLLHNRNEFTRKLSAMMQKNYRNNTPDQNIAILDRIGQYYEGIGMPYNDYYKEQLALLLQIAQEQRVRGFHVDQILGQANEIYMNKVGGKMAIPNQEVNLRVENAYSAMNKGDMRNADRIINQAMVYVGLRADVPIDTQLKLMQAKGIIQSSLNGPNQGDIYFQKGLELTSNRNNFLTQHQMLDSHSTFQHLLSKNIIAKVAPMKGSLAPQQLRSQLAKCQSYLLAARDTKSQLPIQSPVPLAQINETLGDLALLREDSHGAGSMYQKAARLYQSSSVPISDTEKIRLYNKLYNHYVQHSQNIAEQERIKAQINMFKQHENIGSAINDKKYFKKIKYQRDQARGQIAYRNNSIQQVDQRFQQQQSKYALQKPVQEALILGPGSIANPNSMANQHSMPIMNQKMPMGMSQSISSGPSPISTQQFQQIQPAQQIQKQSSIVSQSSQQSFSMNNPQPQFQPQSQPVVPQPPSVPSSPSGPSVAQPGPAFQPMPANPGSPVPPQLPQYQTPNPNLLSSTNRDIPLHPQSIKIQDIVHEAYMQNH